MIPMVLTLCLALAVGVTGSSCDARAASLPQRSSTGRLYGYPASFLGTDGRPIHLDQPSTLPYNFTLPRADMKYSQFGRGSRWSGLEMQRTSKNHTTIPTTVMPIEYSHGP